MFDWSHGTAMMSLFMLLVTNITLETNSAVNRYCMVELRDVAMKVGACMRITRSVSGF